MESRRGFFRHAGVLAFGARIEAALVASVARAAALDPPEGSSFLDAEHVVILMQENRSFDHMFGTLRGVRGFDDPRAVTLPDGKPVWLQSNQAGETHGPFHLDLKNTSATWLGSLPHAWSNQQDARNRGNHDGWLDAKRSGRKEAASLPFTMGYYNRGDLPFYYALADAFTICDQNFCSSLTGTTPNRLHLWTGTIRESPDSPPNVRNSDVDYGSSKNWKTFPERLEEAGVSWRVYQNEISAASGLEGESDAWLANFTDNPLEWFDRYRVETHRKHRAHMDLLASELPARIAKLRAQGDPESKLHGLEKQLAYAKDERARAAKPRSAREQSLHEKAFTTNEGDPDYRKLTTLRYRDGDLDREMKVPKGDPLFRFRQDAAGGKLPAISWVVPPERISDHPSSPWYGAWFVSEILNVLTENPDIWRKTIFVLAYDENDGYFDHIPPFVAPDPLSPEGGRTSPGLDPAFEYLSLAEDRKSHPADEARGGPVGLGFRVPLIVASPWSRGGYVCSQVFDHTSVLQLLERMAGRWSGKEVRETNITAWRRTVCGDLTSAFRPFETGQPKVESLSRDAVFEQVHHAQFLPMPSGYANRTMPKQEPGVRPSTPLPYDLSASGVLTADGKQFEITLESRGAAGAPFHVYTPGKYRDEVKARTRAYAVAAGQRLTDTWELEGFPKGAYH
ncbi:MAG: phospholipase C, phosphocholine-specific, partial [Acidobacteriota bacterium]|nr:phospholipase C, phosphocholine-specific [Acidobacteriota bacterium]